MYLNFFKNPISYLILCLLFIFSCNDDLNENKEFTKFEPKNENNIYEIITSLDYTVQKSLNQDHTNYELSQIFSDKIESMGVEPISIDKTIDSLNLSADYWQIANQIANPENHSDSKRYKNHLQNLKSNLNNYDLTSKELQVSKINIDFMLAFVNYLENLDKSNSNNLSKSDCGDWWDCWGSCAAGTIGSAITGAIGGCAALGGIGYTLGSFLGYPGAIIGGAGGCRIGGIAGFIGGALEGAAGSCD